MPNALEITGDVTAAATALAGLIFVFIGSVATSFDGYQKQEQKSILSRYRMRARVAFIGFVLALLSVFFALSGKLLVQEWMAILAFLLLLAALIFSLFAALSAVRKIK